MILRTLLALAIAPVGFMISAYVIVYAPSWGHRWRTFEDWLFR